MAVFVVCRLSNAPAVRAALEREFITEALMQIQASISALTVKTDRLISDVEKQGDKIDKLRIRFAWVAGGATVVGTLIGIALTLVRFAR
jgi:hypothetical protein